MSLYEDITGKKYVEPSKKELQTIPDWMRNSQPQKKKKNKIIKKSSYLEDGYDFGDITKTILSTTGDLATNVSKGFMNTIEGTVDTARYAIGNATKNSAELQAKVWDFLGNEAYANELRKAGQNVKDYTYKNAQMNVTGALLGETNDLFQTNWSQKLNEGSAAGTLVNSVEQGIGNIGAFVGLAGIGGLAANGAGTLGASTTTTNALTSLTSSNASTFVNSFTSAFGNSMSNALNSGLDEKEARGQAITSGLAEAISEQFFQGIPGLKSAGWADNLISKPIGKYFSGKTGKIALKAIDSVGEGLEEVISNVLQTTFEGIRTNKNVKDIFSELGDTIKSEETREAMISAFISSALTNGAGTLITNNQKNQIIDSYAKEHDMSVKETKQLFDSLVEKKANLEETSNYKERVDLEENISKQLVKDLKADNKIDLNELFKQTPNSLKEMQFRFNQEEAKNVRTEKQNILANDMARLNDEKSNHELYKVINAIQSANDTQQYHITTTEGLYEMGIVKKNSKGEYVMPDGSPYVPRGLNYKNGEIYINADVGSKSGTQAVYHEMFEGFKKAAPEQYNEFKQMVTDIIGEKNIQKEFDTYKSMYGEELTDDIRDEIINDKFGELAENQNFINRIADNRNVLEKLIDSVKNMIKYVKGTPEEKEFIKLQNKLEKEFAKRYKETDFSQGKGDTAYSIFNRNKNKQVNYNFSEQLVNEIDKKTRNANKNNKDVKYVNVEDIYSLIDRKGDRSEEQQQAFVDYVKENGIDEPIIITNNDGVFEIADGNHRVELAHNIGLKEIPVVYDSFFGNVEFDSDEWYTQLEESLNEGRTTGVDGRTQNESINNNRGNEISNYRTNNSTNDRLYQEVQENDDRSSVETTPSKNIVRGKKKAVKDTAFSLTSTKDSQGRDLTPQQQEYFKDSKVVDENGNLKVMYHGTPNGDRTVFKPGTYFTENKAYADIYQNPGASSITSVDRKTISNPRTLETYLNITNPFDISDETTRNIYINEYIKGGNALGINPYMNDDFYNNIKEVDWTEGENLQEWLEENHPEYDGLILDEGGTGGYGEEVMDRGISYVIMNPNQVKNVDNTNPTSNEDIRYSLAPTGEMVDNEGNKVELEVSEVDTELPIRDENKLMVLHNLGENKMNGIMDLDGIPVPSLAITNPYKVDHSGFGEATLIFKKDTIDPAIRENEVYDRDVWSPTQPQIDYYMDSETLENVANKLGIRDYDLEDYADNNKTPEYLSDRLTRVDEIVNKYVEDNNIEYETAYKSPEMKVDFHELSNDIRQFIIDNDLTVYKLAQDENLKNEYYKLIKDYYYNANFPSAVKENLYNEKIDFLNEWIDTQKGAGDLEPVRGMRRYQDDFDLIKKGENQVVDEWQTQKNKREAAIANGLQDYLIKETAPLFKEKGIYNGKDYLTASGNRRSFWQLHDEYNLENIVDAMTAGDTKGTQNWTTGFGQIQAQMANRFNSIEEIRNAENQIMADANNTKLVELREKLESDIDNLSNKYDGWGGMEIASELIADFASQKNHDIDTFRDLLKNNYQAFGRITDNEINQIIDHLEELRELPTDYFEAKPQRAVGLDEIGIGLIPNTWSENTKQRMQEKGIKYIEYDPSISGERQRIEKELTDYMFSLTSNQNIDSKEVAPIGTTTDEMIAPIREDISNLSNQLNNLSNQIQTLQNQPETASDSEIAPVNPYRARAIAQREANQRAEEMYKDENYWKSLEEIANQASDLDEKSVRKMSRNIGKELGLKQKQIKDLQGIIQKSFDKGYSLQDIKNELDRQFGHQQVSERLDDVIDAQRELRNIKIKVSPEIQKDISDYGYWKQQYFGKIRFSNQGSPVDVAYAELSERNPSMYPSNIINPTDQLLRIAEVADMDRKYTIDYEMDKNTIDEAANYIHDTIQETLYANAMKSQTDLEKNAMQYNERTKEIPIKKKSRAEVRENLQNTMGITAEDLQVGNDIKSMSYNLTTPERVNEKVFGREVGRKINEQTVFFAKHQEAERIRFLNKELKEIADLGIKARSKESALVQQYGEGLLDDVQLAQQVSNKATQEKIKNAARVLRSKYDTYLDQINEELVEMGYDPIPKRKDYMRHFQELTDKFSQAGIPFNRQALNSENLPTDINGLTEFNVPGKNWFASAQRRTGEKTTYDAITGIDGYLQGASNLMYHTETIQRYRALENLIRNTYGQQHGLDVFGDDLTSEQAMQRIEDIQNGKLSNYAAWLKEQGNALAGKKGALDRGFERALGRRAYTLASELKKQVGSNMTGFNVRSALTNFISSTIAASKTNKLAMVKGTIDTIQNIFHDDGFIDRSDFLTSRLRGDTSISKKTWQKISNAGQIFMSGSDWFTSNIITRSKYYEGIQKGMTDAQAMNYANDFAARVMGDRSKGATAEAFNSKTLGFLTQFQLETNNQWQYMIHDTKMEFQENLAKEGGLKAGATVLFQVGQLAAYSYLFNEMFEQLTGSRAAFDILDIIKKLFGLDDDDKDKDFEERMKEAGSELVDALPFASLFGSGGRLPIGEMLTPAQTIYDYITGGTNKYGQEITLKDVGNDTLEAIPYYVLPTGYGQIKKTAKGLGMYTNEVPGSYTDSGNLRFTAGEDAGSIIKNALFGQWSSEEAKKYRESGYSTINAKDIPLMRDLDMSSSEFRDFKKNMNEETETSKKVDGTTYSKYFDGNGNTYWYDKDNRTVYDNDMNKTDINVLSLEKANSSELKFDYVSNLPISEDNKQKLFNELFSNTTTDKYGYKKYTDENNKTYWYDEDNDILYNSKYNKVDADDVDGLTEVSESKDMANYKDYGSYAEFDYAYKNPAKYKTMKAIAGYDDYQKYKAELTTIRDNTKNDKEETFEYINSLDLTIPQKAMFLRQYYSTYRRYNNEIVNYVNSLDIDYEDKVEILESLKMKVDSKGNVSWK